MLTHYRQLLRHYRDVILKGSLIAGGLALVLSLLLLRAMPIYESSVTLNMQPSVEELQFNRGFLGVSQFNPATIIAQSHIEMLLSRPVAERAIDKLIAQNDGQLPAQEPTIFDRLRTGFFATIRFLNFGYFTPLSERDTYINDLIGATSVEIVEGSYILRVSISYSDPDIAADAANALAEAYVEQSQIEFAEDADRIDETIEQVRLESEAKLLSLTAERRAIAVDVGIANIAAERTFRLDTRSTALTELQEAEVDLLQDRSLLEELRDAVGREGDADIARQLRQNLVELSSSIAATEAGRVQREENLREAEAALLELDVIEEAFLEVDQRIADVRSDLTELQERAVQLQIAREARLSQVRTINEAKAPIYPKFPKVLTNTITGLIVGAILVLVPIFAADVLGDRIRTTEDLRRSFGPRSLPGVPPRLLQQAEQYLKDGGTAPEALRKYVELLGQKLSSNGPQKWPEAHISVTALGEQENAENLATMIAAMIKILDRRNRDGELLAVKTLPTISKIDDWSAVSKEHVIVAISPGTDLRTDVESIIEDLDPKAPTFGVLVP